ncbi:MAG: exosortase-associated EpsI family protein [Verrucomicrobiota bacterium]
MKRPVLWFSLLLTVLITVGWPMIRMPSATMRLAAIPSSSPDFQARELEISAADRAFLGKAEAVQFLIAMRGGGHLVLTVIDGTYNRHAVHDPNYCFSGAGWQVQSQTAVKVPSGNAAWVTLTKETQTTEALWFFDDGKHQFASPVEYWWATSLRRVTLGRSGAEPILVSLRSLPGEPVPWDRVRQILLPALGFN